MNDDAVLKLTGERNAQNPDALSRRGFFRIAASGAAGLAFRPALFGQEKIEEHKPNAVPPPEIKTNIDEIKKIARKKESMPGKFPGKVIKIATGKTCSEGKVDGAGAKIVVERGLAELTGQADMRKAWLEFVSPSDIVGIKVNPIAGKILTTKPEVVDAIIDGLLGAGVPKKNIFIWDRRLFQLLDAGFTPERFPGIEIQGTEMKGPNGDFYDDKGELWSKDNIDREALPYSAEIEQKYNKNTLPYMINEGRHSYFTKIVTQKCTKIINVPILKNSGATVTLCLKNLAYGSLSNTSRLHKIWAKSVAEPCAFPYLRDKVVLNIVDGLQGCYDKGPGADPKFIWDANIMMFGTDPVAVDLVGHQFIVKERIARGVQQFEDRKRREYLEIAAGLGLGIAEEEKIALKELSLG